MAETRTGKATAHLNVQIVKDGNTIEMYIKGMEKAPIIFKKSSGASGPRAYEKLAKFLE